MDGRHTSRRYRAMIWILLLLGVFAIWASVMWLVYYVLMHLPHH